MTHAFTTGQDEHGNPVTVDVCGPPALARRLWQIAMGGEDRDSIAAIKLLYERMYGMPKQKLPVDDAGDDEDDESDLEGLTNEELRILAKVRASAAPEPVDGDLH